MKRLLVAISDDMFEFINKEAQKRELTKTAFIRLILIDKKKELQNNKGGK